jgi:hypothetical protein
VQLLPARVGVPPAAREIKIQLDHERTEIAKKTDAEFQQWLDRTAVELRKMQDAHSKAGKLAEAVAIRELIPMLRAGTHGEPGGRLPGEAKGMVKEFEDVAAEIYQKAEAEVTKRQTRAAVELKKFQDELTRAGQLAEAVAVRDVIRSIGVGLVSPLPKDGCVSNPFSDLGKVLFYEVTGVSSGHSLCGTDLYATYSHLGMAAVHCGVLKEGQKGIVKVSIVVGPGSDRGSTRNGVISNPYQGWGMAFKVERAYGLKR